MYINFKSKYKKIFWILLGFILSCIFVHKVYAAPSFDTYDFNNFSFSYNNLSYNRESLFNIIQDKLSENNKDFSDFPYISITVPTIPTTNPNQQEYRRYIKILLSSLAPISYFSQSNNGYWYFTYPDEFNSFWIYISLSNGSVSSGGRTIQYIEALSTTFPDSIKGGLSTSNTVSVYSNINFSSLTDTNNDHPTIYTKFYYDSSMLNTGPQLPDYLTGYKKVTLTTDDKYVMLSYLSSGSVYIPTQDFEQYGGRLSYYDKDVDTQPFTSYIQNYYKMPDGEFIRQDFDLSQYYGADWVMFSKYIYLEGEDNITYDIWVPDDAYDSIVEITPNTQGGNDFDFNIKDENGVIQSEQVTSVDLNQINPLLGNVFSDFSSNTFGLTSIITAPLSLISSLSSSSCSTLNVPLPYINSNLTLPCMNTVYTNTFGSFFTLYQTITTGIIAYWVIVKIFNLVKDFKNPDHDEIEVVDL